MKYSVLCGNKKNQFELNKTDEFSKEVQVSSGKKNYRIRIHKSSPTGELESVSINGKIYSVIIRRHAGGLPYKVIINGRAYPVEIDRVESKRFRSEPKRKVDGSIRALLPGIFARITVEENQKVKEGDTLIILEAMKMENEVSAPMDGIIKKIHVSTKDIVSKDQILIEID